MYNIYAIVVIIMFCGLYYMYYYLPNQNPKNKYMIMLLKDETELKNDYINIFKLSEFIKDRTTLYIPKLGYGLTFIWDMFIPNLSSNADWNNGFNILKPIITMNDSPQISYHPKKNYLSIILKYRDNSFYSQFAEIRYNNIKQQTWLNYCVIINGRTIYLLINNSLILTEILPTLPTIYDIQSNITLGQKNNNFLGKIKNLSLIPLPLQLNDIIS